MGEDLGNVSRDAYLIENFSDDIRTKLSDVFGAIIDCFYKTRGELIEKYEHLKQFKSKREKRYEDAQMGCAVAELLFSMRYVVAYEDSVIPCIMSQQIPPLETLIAAPLLVVDTGFKAYSLFKSGEYEGVVGFVRRHIKKE